MSKLEKSRRPGRRPGATRNTDPIIRALFEHIDATGCTYGSIEARAGVAPGRLYRWKAGISSPSYIFLASVAEAIGLAVTLTPMQPVQELDRSQMELAL